MIEWLGIGGALVLIGAWWTAAAVLGRREAHRHGPSGLRPAMRAWHQARALRGLLP